MTSKPFALTVVLVLSLLGGALRAQDPAPVVNGMGFVGIFRVVVEAAPEQAATVR